MDQSELETDTYARYPGKRVRVSHDRSRLVLILLLIGWKSGGARGLLTNHGV